MKNYSERILQIILKRRNYKLKNFGGIDIFRKYDIINV